ncbi:helix-turn-helix domain protein [Paraburkholderia xenovorans LB400]|jgi:AraC-like DNA-binding protein|uniref:AraC family transcriptional regulator n=6 Tax=Pseudomonadota TaxID=1224 RepID=A0A024HJ01_PSEKB|nr:MULTISPECIES: helix-turn-helix transcriptional regulator [Burkholderiales]CAE92899.1 putative transcriptional regulator [Pseudomonas putida]CDF84584.1 AraC family transcriptional regulator [Pseudomonas knackmussii B13]AIP32941.1 helix-turn-helix domain protein [Paraburkholderia xenovorans LB400]CAB3940030.1 HTH-type transcriptional regulator NimR [Achromobacter insolitus]CAB3948856.1 HTH-type transcriptional regulator NimR [Achromobacter insolitus]
MARIHNRDWCLACTSSLKELPRHVYFRAYSLKGGTCVQGHEHVWWQFLFARNGLMQVQAGATTLTLPPDYGVWIPPGCVHTLWIGEEVELESLYIEPTAVAIQDQEPRVVMVDEFVRAFIHHGCTSIPVKYDEDGADGRKVKVLLDSLQSLPDAPFNLPFPTEPRLLEVCLTIQSAPHLAHTLDESAGLARMSSRTFTRHFLRATGLPYHTWRQRMRLLGSLEMLRSDITVTEVALTIGYSTPSAFTHAFKQLFGKSPSRFTRPEPK